ncbi:MAG: BTB/POZ domain-containing protein [Verrucomicrobia bacterium]|nr:BTB/POZ domain-containing protein [Verrucomicrobiota bacterium]
MIPKVAVTQEELNRINLGVKHVLFKYKHPHGYDFIPDVRSKILELAHGWFKEIAENEDTGSFQMQLSNPVYITTTEQSLVRVVMEKLKIKVEFTPDKSWREFVRYYCSSQPGLNLIPKGIQVPSYAADSYPEKHTVTFTWAPNNRFIIDARKPALLQPSAAFAAYTQELKTTEVPHDFVLKVGEHEFPAHKFQLATHSKYFLALLQNNFIEAQSATLEIKDHSPEAVKAMVDYIYSGDLKPSDNVDDTMALAVLAHQFEVLSCVSACEAELSKHVKTHFDEIYQLALRHQLTKLLAYCLQYATTEEQLTTIRNSINKDTLPVVYPLAHNNSIATIKYELEQWQKYNQVAQGLEIVIEKG